MLLKLRHREIRLGFYNIYLIAVIMSSSKPKINIEKAIRQLQISKKYEHQSYALAQIHSNLPLMIETAKIKGSQQSKRSARKVVNNKQNESQPDTQRIQNITYKTLGKTQLKNCQTEIQALKKTEEKPKKQVQESKMKCEQLMKLKLKQKQHLQNLKEIKILKSNLQQIKKKYEQMSSQKNTIMFKYNSLHIENQQLTTTIASLKVEKEALLKKENKCCELEEELIILREQLRQEHLQKESIEARAINFEKRMSQYISKFNEAQEHYNNCQIKYYKLQKDCDNLRVDKDESEQKYNNIQKQLKSQKQINEEQVCKLRLKIKRLQQSIKEQEASIGALKEIQRKRFSESEQLDKLSNQLQKSNQDYSRLKDQSQMQARKWESYIKQLTKQYSQEKETLAHQLHHYKSQKSQFDSRIKDLQQKIDQITQSNVQLTIQNEQIQDSMNSIQSKCQDLINQNQRIFNHYSGLLFQKDEQIKRNRELISHLKIQLEDKGKQQEMILNKINQLQGKLSEGDQYLNQQILVLKEQNVELSSTLENMKQVHREQLEQKQQQIRRITENNLGLAQQLNKCNLQRIQVDMSRFKIKQEMRQYERLVQLNQEYGAQKKYYQQKYQTQLQQYNNLSKYFRQIQQENTTLQSNNTHYIIEISTLRGEIALLQSNPAKLASNAEKSSEITIISSELAYLKKQIQSLLQELNKQELSISALQQENKELREHSGKTPQHKNQLESLSTLKCQIREKDSIIAKIKQQLEQQVIEIRKLNCNISIAQNNYCSLVHKYQSDAQRWEQQKQQFQRQWLHLNHSSEQQKRELEHSRISVAYELDNSQNTISILKKQNMELQKIFGEQIERRNQIIKQLIKQKRSLYGQFVGSQN